MPQGDGATGPGNGKGGGHGHHGGPHDGPHGDHHGGKYDWTGEDAERFLARARRGAHRRYGPFARLVVGSLPGGRTAAPAVVIDLGCGPAMLLVELRGLMPAATLVGVDPSKDMLGLARQVAGEGPAAPAFEVREGRAEAIPADDGAVDLVACRNVLHEWDDTARGFGEVARVLRPGGRLVIMDFDGGYPRWKLRSIAGLTRVLAGRDAARGIIRPFEDALTEDQVHAFCQGAGLAVLSSRRKGRSLFVVAERPV
jgi:SAM-dependent methyltransferase